MLIERACVCCEREPLKAAFGFKGSALTYLLQSSVALYDGEFCGVGVGVQSVLWSDGGVFAAFGEDEGNRLMYSVTEYAVSLIEGRSFENPPEAIMFLTKVCHAYAEEICGRTVSETFVLNALVPLDFALWMLYAKKNGFESFDGIFEGKVKHSLLANIPLITYSTPIAEAVRLAEAGTPIFKIKIGSDPEHDGDPEKMLRWDKERALALHTALKDIQTDYTESGHIVYYFDANGRYDSKERLKDFLDFLEQNGILSQTVLFEEPFPTDSDIYVGDLPCCFAADESVHNVQDAEKKISEGYRALTLKSIAKTLSVTLQMIEYAEKVGVQCFAADLTVNPLMVEWNKNVAARLSPVKGMKIGIVESNGAQNYVNWDVMKTYRPYANAEENEAIYRCSDAFYQSKGLFTESKHYLDLAVGGNHNGK